MTLQFWIGVLVGAIAGGAAIATLILHVVQAHGGKPHEWRLSGHTDADRPPSPRRRW